MDLKELKQLIALMNENDLLELEMVTKDGGKIRLRKMYEGVREKVVAVSALPTAPTGPQEPAPAGGAAAAEREGVHIIRSSMVGTFYRAPSPEAPVFVDIGDEVDMESTVCLIEAMKVFNEIKAEVHGTVQDILVENGEPVEFGMPLFSVRPLD